jgi:hypothetical protein
LDYKIIKKIAKPEGYDEDAVAQAEDGDSPPAQVPEITYLAGRIYLDVNNRWVYE